ncbi:MAG: ATP-binding protein [Tepidisphaeraceae bacterium]
MNWILPVLLAGSAGGLAAAAVVGSLARKRIKAESARADAAEAKARQTRRLAELGTLTGALAHEIKNPLSTVGLNLQLLQEDLGSFDGANDRLRNRLSLVRRETSRLRDILDDFLRYAGKLELDRQPTDLNRVLEELVDFFAPEAERQRVQLRLRPHSVPVIASVDGKILKQAILNLMINAVQAMPNGGELILSCAADDRGEAVIDCIDTGPGIAPDMLDKIFQAYYSTKRGGTGLGLAMARRIAEEHGGTLTVTSVPGKGSDFSLRLPAAPQPATTVQLHTTPRMQKIPAAVQETR